MGYPTALAIVVASMVGTGVFTTLGLQAVDIQDRFALLCLWFLGGLIALCGALSYGELAAAFPRSGGEYNFLSRVYHPVLGIVAGWISVTVGFSAPTALSAMALGHYAATFTPFPPMHTAVATILIVTVFHVFSVRVGQQFQIVTTLLKVILIVFFCVAGLVATKFDVIIFAPTSLTLEGIINPAFATSLIYVSYAFSGWNAATYVAGEIDNPQRVIPRALLHGCAIVTALYLLLNFVFLSSIPMMDLIGKIEIGALSAANIFGPRGGFIMSVMLCVLLISTISAMILAGPRVVQVIGEDISTLRPLASKTRAGAPQRAILLQQALALAFVATDSFEGVLAYAGFTLNIFALLTVMGVIVLRHTAPDLPRPYRTWGYPFSPLLFIVMTLLTLSFVLQERPAAAMTGIITVLTGLTLGFIHHKRQRL